MKKYDVHLLISSQGSYSFWQGLESNSKPRMINEGVINIGDVYFNAVNVEELIIIENHQS